MNHSFSSTMGNIGKNDPIPSHLLFVNVPNSVGDKIESFAWEVWVDDTL